MSSISKEFKIIIVGDAEVGKTAFIHKYLTEEFKDTYIPTKNVETNSICFNTSAGNVIFTILDISSKDRYSWGSNEYLSGVNAAIIMVDLTNRISYQSTEEFWLPIVKKYYSEIPIIVIGNKCDCKNIKTASEKISELDVPSFFISSKEGTNIKTPFLYLVKTLLENNSLIFLKSEVVSA